MADRESLLIDRIRQRAAAGEGVLLGVGDDAAILQPPREQQLVSCMDTLVAGVHFPTATAAADIGHKALAVNLSDMAAMGATPSWALLSLTAPDIPVNWLDQFLDGFLALAAEHRTSLVGGDLSRGPMSITVQISGWVDSDCALYRGKAVPGDHILVSGNLGSAAWALQCLQRDQAVDQDCLAALNRPRPRVELARLIAPYCSSAIDISDGLLLDLERLLAGSGQGARLQLGQLPTAKPLAALAADLRWPLQLAGGDDYELLFTAATEQLQQIRTLADQAGTAVRAIGQVSRDTGISCLHPDGGVYTPAVSGYTHFHTNGGEAS